MEESFCYLGKRQSIGVKYVFTSAIKQMIAYLIQERRDFNFKLSVK